MNRSKKTTTRTMNMTDGNPLPLLAAFAFPLLVGNLFQQAYNLADSIIVGHLIGASALAAVGATGSVTFLFFSICNGISSGCGVVASQCFGAGDEEKVKKAIANSAYIMFAAALLMGSIAYIAAPWALSMMGTPADILPDSITYMRMNCIGVLMVAVFNYSSSMLRALGDSRTPLYFLITACVLNIGMDLFCVKILGLGVFGAALATIIAQLIAGIGCLSYALRYNSYFHISRKERAFDKEIALRSIRLGIPLALQWSLIAVSTTALQTVVNSFGTSAVAAYTSTCRIEQLIQQPFGSLSIALSTYSGQNMGAKKIHRIRKGLSDGFLAMGIFSLAMMTVVQLFSGQIIRVFVDEPEVLRLGRTALILTSRFYFFLGTIYVIRGVLNGVGDALFSLINGIIEMLCRIFLPMLLLLIPGVGVFGIWWTAGLTWVLSAFFCVLRYLAWKRKQSRSTAGTPLEVCRTAS